MDPFPHLYPRRNLAPAFPPWPKHKDEATGLSKPLTFWSPLDLNPPSSAPTSPMLLEFDFRSTTVSFITVSVNEPDCIRLGPYMVVRVKFCFLELEYKSRKPFPSVTRTTALAV
ncbi:hypothetical protein AALP_AA1G291400 [Arabis alpina]|uniref:Uncharacterized protein n=1 Tax=Arabis alpina TaxID=50452 RepID=A0A087HRE4_ARAAL|nr:hypothetical protein AALP_AA1G291400 [Arabis alpina]